MKYLFCISRYSDNRQNIFDQIISPRNREFAQYHEYKYVEILNQHDIKLFRNNPTWWKYTIIQDLLNSGKLKDGDYIVNIDADMYFHRIDYDLIPRNGKSYSLSIDSSNTWCQGWIGFHINEWSRQLINNVLSEERWNTQKNKITIHEGFNTYSSFHQEFREQAAIYSLFGIKRHSNTSFWDMDNCGIWSDKTDMTIYTPQDLEKHVDLFPTTFNVTQWEGESSMMFYINKINEKKDVIIRHLTGCSWENVKNWI